jgi:structural maintenance of chromosome 4
VQPKKEEYRVAFFKVFGQTLVCENIDIAKHIKFSLSNIFILILDRNVRLVTLDGKQIEASGVMSGGGQPRKGGMLTSA